MGCNIHKSSRSFIVVMNRCGWSVFCVRFSRLPSHPLNSFSWNLSTNASSPGLSFCFRFSCYALGLMGMRVWERVWEWRGDEWWWQTIFIMMNCIIFKSAYTRRACLTSWRLLSTDMRENGAARNEDIVNFILPERCFCQDIVKVLLLHESWLLLWPRSKALPLRKCCALSPIF